MKFAEYLFGHGCSSPEAALVRAYIECATARRDGSSGKSDFASALFMNKAMKSFFTVTAADDNLMPQPLYLRRSDGMRDRSKAGTRPDSLHFSPDYTTCNMGHNCLKCSPWHCRCGQSHYEQTTRRSAVLHGIYVRQTGA